MAHDDDLDCAVDAIVNARDEQDALHLLTCEEEVQQFYWKTFKYRVEDEYLFYYKMLGFKDASKSKPLPVTPKKTELLLFVRELKKIAHELWPDSTVLHPKATRLFEEITSLQAAVESEDSRMIEVYSDNLWDPDRTFSMGDNRFRKALAELNGADLFKVQLFEAFLLSVVRHREWFSTLTLSSIQRDGDELMGLKIVTQYLETDSYVPVQFPWLSDFLLLMLLDGLLFEANYSIEQKEPPLRFREHKDIPLLIENLTLFRSEICARHYDPHELARRLRRMEDADGRYLFPSLIYPLLATHSKGVQ